MVLCSVTAELMKSTGLPSTPIFTYFGSLCNIQGSSNHRLIDLAMTHLLCSSYVENVARVATTFSLWHFKPCYTIVGLSVHWVPKYCPLQQVSSLHTLLPTPKTFFMNYYQAFLNDLETQVRAFFHVMTDSSMSRMEISLISDNFYLFCLLVEENLVESTHLEDSIVS